MMKHPFTNAGFVALQQQLYALSNEALAAEAQLISTAFGQWLLANFELSTSQQAFFTQLNTSALALYSSETAFAIQNRLNITLDKDEEDKDEQGKIIWSVSSLSARAGLNNFEASGSLCFYIRYLASQTSSAFI